MAIGMLILGQSGTGKSTAARNLSPKSTFIINVAKKPLPFKGWKSAYTEISKENPLGNMLSSDNYATIMNILEHINTKRPEIKVIIIDDNQYLMANEYMKRAKETGFQKFVDISQNAFKLADSLKNLRDDLYVVVNNHIEVDKDEFGKQVVQAKTIGKMFTQYVTLEGLYSIVLYTKVYKKDDGDLEYVFVTQNDGNNTAKSPMGLFNSIEIPNDLNEIIKQIELYNK